MERSPGIPAEAHHDNTSDKKKKRVERAAILRVPLVFEQENRPGRSSEQPADKPRATPLEAALANLAAKDQEKTAAEPERTERTTKDRAAEATAPVASEAAQTDGESEPSEAALSEVATAPEVGRKAAAHEGEAVDEDDPEAEPEAEETYLPLPNQELQSVDLSGGEVVIHLQGDTPVRERVVPTETVAIDTVRPPAVEAAPPVFAPQPEQRPVQAVPPEQLPLAETAADIETSSRSVENPAASAAVEQPNGMPPVEIIRPQLDDIYAQHQVAPSPVSGPRGEQPATRRDVENMAYRAERAGQNRGVFAGLLVGGAYEHFKHKRRERRQEKRMQAQSKQLESARQSYDAGLQEQAHRQAEAANQYEFVERRVGGLERRQEALTSAEKPKVQPIAEAPAEQLEIPPEHRLETSSWHSIEVDARTGKPVENPAFQYGQEYHRERAQESAQAAQRQVHETTADAASVAAPSGASAAGDDRASLPPVYIPSASTQRPAGSSTQDNVRKKQPADDGANPAPLWPWILALVAVVITLAVVLR